MKGSCLCQKWVVNLTRVGPILPACFTIMNSVYYILKRMNILTTKLLYSPIGQQMDMNSNIRYIVYH